MERDSGVLFGKCVNQVDNVKQRSFSRFLQSLHSDPRLVFRRGAAAIQIGWHGLGTGLHGLCPFRLSCVEGAWNLTHYHSCRRYKRGALTGWSLACTELKMPSKSEKQSSLGPRLSCSGCRYPGTLEVL